MPLTPADVHNVAFSKPPIGKRGYNEDEVDQFLDLIEDTLAQLQEENEDLRSKVSELEKSGGKVAAAPVATPAPAVDTAAIEKKAAADAEAKVRAEFEKKLADAEAANKKLQDEANKARQEAQAAKEEAKKAASSKPAAAAAAPAAAAAAAGAGAGAAGVATADTHMQAARVLGLAQEMSDRLTSEARAESKSMLDEARAAAEKTINDANSASAATLSEARAKADKMTADADQKAKAMIADATQRSEKMIADATTQSQTQLKQAEDKANALQADAEKKHTEIMATVKQQQSVLEGRISELRTFEREYRTRMKTLLETQLEELVSRGPAAPAGNPDQQ